MASLSQHLKYGKKTRLWVFAISLALSSILYLWTLRNGEIFRDLAEIYSSANGELVEVEDLRRSWWANYEKHPTMALLWVTIGALVPCAGNPSAISCE